MRFCSRVYRTREFGILICFVRSEQPSKRFCCFTVYFKRRKSQWQSQAAQTPAVRWSSCVISVMAKIKEFVWEYWPLFGGKNTFKFSPHFHSASLVVWTLTLLKRGFLASYPFLGFLLLREGQGCTVHFRTPDPRGENSDRRPKLQLPFGVGDLKMNNSLKWLCFSKVRIQKTSDSLWSKVNLTHFISSKQAGWSIFFIVFLGTDVGKEHLRKD